MHQVQIIESLDLPELAPYRTMRWQSDQRQQGYFVTEGNKVIERLLQSHYPIVSMVLEPRWYEAYRNLILKRSEDFVVYLAPKDQLIKLTGYHLFQGALAVAQIPSSPSLLDLLKDCPNPRLWVALDGITNAENVGVITRNCAAFGVQTLIAGHTCCSPFLRRAVRASMGGLFKIRLFEGQPLTHTLAVLRTHHVFCLAAHPHTCKQKLDQLDLRQDLCLVFGSEGEGLSPEVLSVCHTAVAIPMAHEIDSLNVGSATAAFLYETQRQRS